MSFLTCVTQWWVCLSLSSIASGVFGLGDSWFQDLWVDLPASSLTCVNRGWWASLLPLSSVTDDVEVEAVGLSLYLLSFSSIAGGGFGSGFSWFEGLWVCLRFVGFRFVRFEDLWVLVVYLKICGIWVCYIWSFVGFGCWFEDLWFCGLLIWRFLFLFLFLSFCVSASQ